jgi:pimeloyl-ACP methyl ester carboxylesterase
MSVRHRARARKHAILIAGTGPSLVLLHTVRTQLDYFQRVIPLLWDSFTVYAVDLPGMGWSDIVPGARYEQPDLHTAVVEFITGLDLHDVTLAGESLGAALALSASIDLKDKLSEVVAFNPYDYPSGLERGNWLARVIGTSIRLPGSGPVFARMESRPILKGVMRGGFVDASKLPKEFLIELRRSGSRKGYPTVGRAIMRSLNGLIQARGSYEDRCSGHPGLQRAGLVAPGRAGSRRRLGRRRRTDQSA